MYALFPFPTLACASILIATRVRAIPLPEGWHELFDIEYEDMLAVSDCILRLYRERSEEDKTRWMLLAVGGKKAVRQWLDENIAPSNGS